MAQLTMDQARTILAKHVQEPHLLTHALAVSAAMGAMAEHFGADRAYWEAVGYLHDVDYEKFPDEHLQHTHALLAPEGVDEAEDSLQEIVDYLHNPDKYREIGASMPKAFCW